MVILTLSGVAAFHKILLLYLEIVWPVEGQCRYLRNLLFKLPGLVWGIIVEYMLSKGVHKSHQLLQPGLGEGVAESDAQVWP